MRTRRTVGRKAAALLLGGVLALGTAACEEDVEEGIEEGVQDVEEGAEDVGEEIEEGVDEEG